MPKKFRLSPNEIRPIAPGKGGCIATDHITVDGHLVGFMYRIEAAQEQDSGWRFFSGTEDRAYLADNSNSAVYDVNTIANYDAAIVPFLDAPCDSYFERDDTEDTFREIANPFKPPTALQRLKRLLKRR